MKQARRHSISAAGQTWKFIALQEEFISHIGGRQKTMKA
jgi:hypothetical protein